VATVVIFRRPLEDSIAFALVRLDCRSICSGVATCLFWKGRTATSGESHE